jgi:hypothetical protein
LVEGEAGAVIVCLSNSFLGTRLSDRAASAFDSHKKKLKKRLLPEAKRVVQIFCSAAS